MQNKQKNEIYSLGVWGKKATAITNKHLLFFQFECPHCHQLNVMGKTNVQEHLICSNSSCKRIIILENYQDIA
jgi:transcription elongation factor Elf1